MPITLPVPAVAWNILPCQRVTYASVLQVSRDVVFLIVKRLIAQGWTVRGSSNGAAAGMDGVDRWATAADAGTRFNGVAGAQSWFVLRDGDGADIVFSFNGATDDVWNFWVSLGGLAIANATNVLYEPTATDAQTTNKFYTTTPGTIVGATASLDRLVSVWTRPDHRGFRVAVARNAAWISRFGKDAHTPATYASGITVHPGHAFYINGSLSAAASGSILHSGSAVANAANLQFIVRTKRTDGAGVLVTCAKYTKVIGGNGNPGSIDQHTYSAVQSTLQGAASYALRRYGIWSITATADGDIGLFVDWFLGRTTGSSDGDTYGALQWITVDAPNGVIWPWDGATPVAMS